MHRDLKPENILINYLGEVTIADLAFICPVEKGMYTRYIATRWYRAPEQILRMEKYDSKVDIWALGCVLAELVL